MFGHAAMICNPADSISNVKPKARCNFSTSLTMKVAFLDETLVLSSADDSLRDIIFNRSLFGDGPSPEAQDEW